MEYGCQMTISKILASPYLTRILSRQLKICLNNSRCMPLRRDSQWLLWTTFKIQSKAFSRKFCAREMCWRSRRKRKKKKMSVLLNLTKVTVHLKLWSRRQITGELTSSTAATIIAWKSRFRFRWRLTSSRNGQKMISLKPSILSAVH